MAGRNLGKNAQARSRREAREQRKAMESELNTGQLYHAPPADECDVDPSDAFLDPTNRLHTTYYYYRGRLVRFFMAWQSLERGEEWIERYSVCTKHGYLHEHRTGHQMPDDARNIDPLYSQADVQESHDKAYDMVLNRYQLVSRGGEHG